MSTFDNLKTGCEPYKHWGLTTCQPFHKKNTGSYKIVQEKKSTWKALGQCKAVAVRFNNMEKRSHQNRIILLLFFSFVLSLVLYYLCKKTNAKDRQYQYGYRSRENQKQLRRLSAVVGQGLPPGARPNCSTYLYPKRLEYPGVDVCGGRR